MESDAGHFHIGVGEETANLIDRKKFISSHSRFRSFFETIFMGKNSSSKEIIGKKLSLAK